jgi:peptidoglycan-associated lipoprotein
MRRGFLCLVTFGLFLSFLLTGCSRHKPKTAPEAPALAETTVAPPPAPAPPEPEPTAAPEPADPLAGDLDTVNEYVRSQGLLGDVYYAYDSSDLSDDARQRLADNAQFLRRYPAFAAMIEGHCDERGTPEYNLALGERRASAARDYLGSLGVDTSRLRTLSYGEERPVCTETEESCLQQNRRAHFVITGRQNEG